MRSKHLKCESHLCAFTCVCVFWGPWEADPEPWLWKVSCILSPDCVLARSCYMAQDPNCDSFWDQEFMFHRAWLSSVLFCISSEMGSLVKLLSVSGGKPIQWSSGVNEYSAYFHCGGFFSVCVCFRGGGGNPSLTVFALFIRPLLHFGISETL